MQSAVGCQLAYSSSAFVELRVVVMRGGAQQRLKRLEDGEIDALVMPAAWADWLHVEDRVSEILSVDAIVPAAGQGSLCLLGRVGEKEYARWVLELRAKAFVNEPGLNQFTLQELYGGYRFSESAKLKIGRIRVNWNEAGHDWKLGAWQPRDRRIIFRRKPSVWSGSWPN